MACLWIGISVFDLCIFSLTLWKTYYTYKDGYMSGGLLTIVMRDGLMYFGIITLASLANIVVFLLGGVQSCSYHQKCHDVASDVQPTGGSYHRNTNVEY
ncbi:hypothetical protein C8R42DRAFT_660870, partial [Lentinula raphanica]